MGWLRRKAKRITREQAQAQNLTALFDSLPKPPVVIPSTARPRVGYWCSTQHYGRRSGIQSAGVHYHPGTMRAGSSPSAPKK